MVDLIVGYRHVHVDRAFRGDLRSDVKFQHGIHELHRNRIVHDRLDWNLRTLFHGRFLVVLRDEFRLRDQLAHASLLRRADNVVQREVRGRESVAQCARWRRGAQVRDQRHRAAGRVRSPDSPR